MTAARLPLQWRPRAVPLPPCAVVGLGAASRALARAALARTSLEGLLGVAGDGVLLLSGRELPWAPGVTYLGESPGARALWLPTTQEPHIHPALLERALLARTPLRATPLAVLPDRWVPAGGALPVTRERLAAWLEGADG